MNGEGFSIEMMHGNWRESSYVRGISVTWRITTLLRYSPGSQYSEEIFTEKLSTDFELKYYVRT